MIQSLPSVEASRWLQTRRPLAAPRARLLCFPYAGGGATCFHAWSAGLPADVEVRAAQLPGRQERLSEPALKSVSAVVEKISAALLSLPPAPLLIYGHSYGAILAFELARTLLGTSLCPQALIIAARRGPQTPTRIPTLFQLPDSAFKEALHRHYGTSRSVLDCQELMEIALPSLRADFTAVETYQYVPSAPINIPITVLHGLRDASVSAAEISAWQEITTFPIQIHSVDAGHLFIDTHRAWVLERVAAICREFTQNN